MYDGDLERERNLESWLERNLELLAHRQPQLAEIVAATPSESIEVFPSVKGLPTARLARQPASTILLHSKYDPLQEARQNVKKTNLEGADYFVLLGFGLGYNLDALTESVSCSDSRFFVIESDTRILKAALQARDLSRVLSLPHLHFAWPITGADLSHQWQKFFDPVHARGSAFVSHVPSIALNPELYKSAAEIVQSQTFQIFTDINTLVIKAKVFLENFIENLPHALASPGVGDFVGQMSGIPAVLVSAGPSLDKNIHELRGCENGALILSTDTALKPLLAAGVQPHFVLSGDPTEANYLHVKGAKTTTSLFVVEATGHPGIFDEFGGRTITCMFENSALRSLSDLLGQKGTLSAWGSVATMALDFALRLRCDPVIFIGQDLAHSEGRTYCTGLYWEEQLFAGVSTPEQWKERWESLRAGKTTITMTDIFGNPVETTDKLAAYWNWINKEIQAHPETTFVNATEGGILRDGIRIMSLREAKYRFFEKDLGLVERTQEVFKRACKFKMELTEDLLAPLQTEARNLRRRLSQGKELCTAQTARAPDDLLRDLELVKSAIYANPQLGSLLDTLNQLGNVAFLRRQSAFKPEMGKSSNDDPVKIAYLEYFDSVGKALDLVEGAVSRLKKPRK